MEKYICKNCTHGIDNGSGCCFAWFPGREGCKEDYTEKRETYNLTRVKNNIKTRLAYCVAIADDIVKHNASPAVIVHAKKWAEIETPITGETSAPWVRINWGDIWIFLYMDKNALNDSDAVIFTGRVAYQLDPFAGYGGELIDVCSVDAFMQELEKIDLESRELVKNEYNGDFSADDWSNATPPRDYIPYNLEE